MASQEIDDFTELAEGPAVADLLVLVDSSDTTDSPQGTTKKNKAQYGLGNQVNAQTGTSYIYLTTDFRKLVTHTNGSAIAATLPQAGASFPAGWFMFVQNRGAGALTITPTTSTVDGAATLILNQNEGALVVSDGANYFTFRGKATGGAGGIGDVVGPSSATDNAIARFDSATGKLIQNSVVILSDAGAITVPEIAAPSTPAAGTVHIYAKSDKHLYIKDSTGTETDLTATGGGSMAPLFVESANEIAQRNGTTPQNFYVYKSTDGGSNWSRLNLGWDGANNLQIWSENNGTGTLYELHLRYGATRRLAFKGSEFVPDANNVIALGNSTARWSAVRAVDSWVSGKFIFENGSTIEDAGASFGGVVKFGSNITGPGTWSGGEVSPITLGSNQNNYDPATIANFQRWTASTPVDVTGMTRFQQAGQMHLIVNASANAITLKHQDTNSTAANRFLCSTGADIVLNQDQAADLTYDSTTQRWRVFKRT